MKYFEFNVIANEVDSITTNYDCWGKEKKLSDKKGTDLKGISKIIMHFFHENSNEITINSVVPNPTEILRIDFSRENTREAYHQRPLNDGEIRELRSYINFRKEELGLEI